VIPQAQITAWRAHAPWADDALVEQDLVLSRAVVEIFSNETIAANVALRGGTAYHKVFLAAPGRYSEDIDLVQTAPGPIGPLIDALRGVFDPLLGEPRRKKGEGGTTLTYKFSSEIAPIRPLRVKLEINTREQFTVFGHVKRPFSVTSPWFTGEAAVVTYSLEELFGTKLRALYQRRKGRDLYDLWLALQGGIDPERVVHAFQRYIAEDGSRITRAEFETNLADKMSSPRFMADLLPLLAPGTNYDPAEAHQKVLDALVRRL
jgi:predicted nucleotidyltransferase component of viral defense system